SGPRTRENQLGRSYGSKEPVPYFGIPVPEDNRDDTIPSSDSSGFCEGPREMVVVVRPSAMILVFRAAFLDDNLVCLVLKATHIPGYHRFWVHEPKSTFQPNVTKVRGIAVIDH